MKYAKKLLCLLLTLCMVVGMFPVGAMAAEGMGNFTLSKTYADTFADVSADDWFYYNVKNAYEYGLMEGNSARTFNPNGNVTLAETITVAARLHAIYHAGKESFANSNPWYKTYVDYCMKNGIIEAAYSDYNMPATRAQFAVILAAALPNAALKEINDVDDNAIPDVDMNADYAKAVYKLYRAGILTGNDAQGTFAPQSAIRRSEVAAIVSRMADSYLRESISLSSSSGSVIGLLPPFWDNEDDEPENPDEPTGDMIYEELLQEKQKELDAIQERNGGEMPEMMLDKEDSIPSYILGSYSGKTVTDYDSAIDSLSDISYLMNMDNAEEEFEGISTNEIENTTQYRLQQFHNGISVYGKQLIVTTDENGGVTSLGGNYDPIGEDFNEEVTVSMADAYAIAVAAGYGVEETAEQVAYTLDGYQEYAWKFVGTDTVIVSAVDGTILESFSNIMTLFPETDWTPAEGIVGTGKVNTAFDPEENNYVFYDSVRNILYHDRNGTDNYHWANYFLEEPLRDEDNIWTTDSARKAAQLQDVLSDVYDYYFTFLGLRSFDGNNELICAFVNDGWSNGNNAVCWPYTMERPGASHNTTLLAFGENEVLTYGLVGHEYTHAVQWEAIQPNYCDEMGALMEGYADIGGELIEAHYTGEAPDWHHGDRNIADPTSVFGVVEYDLVGREIRQVYPQKYNGLGYYTRSSDNGGVHHNSTVISHIAYEMWEDGFNDVEELTELFYRAWNYLGPASGFVDYRMAMLAAAKDMDLSVSYTANIVDAFDHADIFIESFDQWWGASATFNCTVTEMDGRTEIPSAVIEISSDGVVVAQGYTDMAGSCSLNVRPGTYQISVSATGYRTRRTEGYIGEDETLNLRIPLSDNSNQDAELICEVGGTVKDAMTGVSVPDATLTFRKGYNVTSGRSKLTLHTNSDGKYYTDELNDYGYYTVEIVKEGYIRSFAIVQVAVTNWENTESTNTLKQDISISPMIEADDTLRIVLTWGENPNDLDSHITGALSNGNHFEVYFGNKNAYESDGSVVANLDLDDTTGYGPETTTLQWREGVEYRFFIHLFSGSGTLSTSAANVKVYSGNYLIHDLNVPTGSDTSRIWNVFTFRDGEFTIQNTFS